MLSIAYPIGPLYFDGLYLVVNPTQKSSVEAEFEKCACLGTWEEAGTPHTYNDVDSDESSRLKGPWVFIAEDEASARAGQAHLNTIT